MKFTNLILLAAVGMAFAIAQTGDEVIDQGVERIKCAPTNFIGWDPNSETDLAGYVIVATRPGGAEVGRWTTTATSVAISQLVAGPESYGEIDFALRAFNTLGIHSDPAYLLADVNPDHKPKPPTGFKRVEFSGSILIRID